MSRSIAVDAARGALWVWLLLHLGLSTLSGITATAATVVVLPPLVGAILLLDQRACGEGVILGNVGVPGFLAPVAGGLVTFVLESLAFLALR